MTQYHLVTNSVAPSQVRETESAYVIEDVPFVRPMELAGGYVPESNIQDTIDQWGGVPVTLNHPRNDRGEPVAANRQPETHLGTVADPYYDGDVARATVRLEKDRLESVDGATAVTDRLENGKRIDVSSQYAAADLPAGEYDGQMRENVERITRPDSLAILPNQRGRCSIEDGCGIDPTMVANAEVRVPMTRNATHDGEDMDAAAVAYELTNVAPDDVEEWTDDEWDGSAAVAAMPNPSEGDGAADALDQTHAVVPADADARENKANWKLPFRRGPDAPVNTRALVAIDAALSGARDGVEGLSDDTRSAVSSWVESMLDTAPDGLFGSVDDSEQSSNVLSAIGRQVTDALGLTAPSESDDAYAHASPLQSGSTIQSTNSTPTTPAESGVDSSDSTEPPTTMNRATLIDETTSNSALTEAALAERCDDGLEAIHDDIMSNTTDDAIGLDDLSDEAVDELESRVADRIEANRNDNQKADLAREIVANSAEYDDTEAVREDFPTVAALETKRGQLADTQTVPGVGGGMAANADLGSDDGPDVDVSSGLLGQGGEN